MVKWASEQGERARRGTHADMKSLRMSLCRGSALAAGLVVAWAAIAQPRVDEPIGPLELLGGERRSWNLEQRFAGEELAFEAMSSNPMLAKADIDGTRLTVTANADGNEGMAIVTATATDRDGHRAQLEIRVVVAPQLPSFYRSWRLALRTGGPTTLPRWEEGKLALVDAIPAPNASVDPTIGNLDIVHLGSADMTFDYPPGCRGSVAIRRSLPGMGIGETHGAQLIDHRLHCQLAANTAQSLSVEVESGPSQHQATLEFATGGASTTPRLSVLESLTTPMADVNYLFQRYLDETLLDNIDPEYVILAAALLDRIARNAWPRLRRPGASYDVTAQRVSYASRTPDGAPSEQLTGLVAMPDVEANGFLRKDRVVVLSHATGSTPSNFDFADTWFVLANMFAGRGYLVIAPDNWGRGDSTKALPETYLLANRTANNSIDLIDAVLADSSYDAFHNGHAADGRADIALFGYSQGGHSALALWLALEARPDNVDNIDVNIDVRELYSGGAPHDLYNTFRGTLQHVHGTCDNNPWCRHVDASVVPYATGRILPGMLAYTRTDLTAEDLIDGNDFNATFVSGMLGGDSRYDALKAMLALNSFTNIVNLASAIDSDTRINLYHSQYDRLVPYENTRKLNALLTPDFAVDFHDDECNSYNYKTLFELIDTVGALHAVCGMEVADEVLRALP